MNLGQSIRSGVKWLAVGNVGSQVVEFVFGIVMARLLVPADFGLLATTQIFTGLAGLVAAGGMGASLVQAKHVEESDFNGVFTVQFAIGLAIYLGFFFVAPHFAVWFDDPGMKTCFAFRRSVFCSALSSTYPAADSTATCASRKSL